MQDLELESKHFVRFFVLKEVDAFKDGSVEISLTLSVNKSHKFDADEHVCQSHKVISDWSNNDFTQK